MIDLKLLKILCCPLCKEDVVLTEGNDFLVCVNCKRKYFIRDNTPIMLIEEAILEEKRKNENN